MNHKGASAVSLALLARWRDMREREGGRAESARQGRRRVGTRAERTILVRATTRAVRAKSVGVFGKMGSNRVQ